ncbi:MAG: hypothetical protein AB7I09_18195 [Planctomycetota bacterium]
MSDEILTRLAGKSAESFAHQFVQKYLQGGFQSLLKRDVDLLVFYELERSGAVDEWASNHEVARVLRITPRRVATLRHDSYARWADTEHRRRRLERRLKNYFTEANIAAVLRESRPEDLKSGLLPVLLEHPAERADFEEAIKRVRGVPRYERNREVLLVSFHALTELMAMVQLGRQPKEALELLARELAKHATLKSLLRKDVTKISTAEARAVLNDVGATITAKAVENSTPGLLASLWSILLGGG